MHDQENEIKQYSSLFATKMNYVLDLIKAAPLQHGRARAIEDLTHEKASTVNNWLFNGRLPRDNKKLAVADAIGVSHHYLFDDSIDVEAICKPEIYRDGHCYLIPYITEDKLFELKTKTIFPIQTRLPLMFPNFDEFIKKYGVNLYVTRLNDGVFEPHVHINSDIVYSEQVVFEDFRLVIHEDKKRKKSMVKRVVEENNQLYLELLSGKDLVKEPLNQSDSYVSIALIYSR